VLNGKPKLKEIATKGSQRTSKMAENAERLLGEQYTANQRPIVIWRGVNSEEM
jgi:hypothetical protein